MYRGDFKNKNEHESQIQNNNSRITQNIVLNGEGTRSSVQPRILYYKLRDNKCGHITPIPIPSETTSRARYL